MLADCNLNSNPYPGKKKMMDKKELVEIKYNDLLLLKRNFRSVQVKEGTVSKSVNTFSFLI